MNTVQTCIQFPSYYKLRAFMRAADFKADRGFEISITKFILSCRCTKQQQELAVEIYEGKVINVMQETDCFA